MADNKIKKNGKYLKKCKDVWQSILKRVSPFLRFVLQKLHSLRLWMTSSWRLILAFLPVFLFFYYIVGSMIAENIDVKTQRTLPEETSKLAETPETMAFLIKREIDEKMWVPNLPPVFPAGILDNMPNFQIGIISGVRDITSVLPKLAFNTTAQQENAAKAEELIAYAPNIWLMSRQENFKLAPSSNSQYRKAAKVLRQYRQNGIFVPAAGDLDMFLQKMSSKLQKYVRKTENQIQEHSSDWIDLQCDDLFYFNKGYSFALWQISKSLGLDYKQVILDYNIYTDWTFVQTSLQKAAEFSPAVIRNGEPDALFAPNHMQTQIFYMMRAIAYIEEIRQNLARGYEVQPN